MRAYFFGNMYLSSIQQGIQAQHATSEIFIKYLPHQSPTLPLNSQWVTLVKWASSHKTSILCNAGYSSEIRSLIELFSDPENSLPWVEFRESNDALDGALTTVGIILPPQIYDRSNIGAFDRLGQMMVKGESVQNVTEWLAYDHCKYIDPITNDMTRLSKYEAALSMRLGRYSLAR